MKVLGRVRVAAAYSAILAATAGVAGSPASARAAKPDLRVAKISFSPGARSSGSRVTFVERTVNAGGDRARPATTGIYLSRNRSLGSTDRLLVTRQTSGLGRRRADTGRVRGSLPADLAGHFTVFACADFRNIVDESDERNNCRRARRRLRVLRRSVPARPQPVSTPTATVTPVLTATPTATASPEPTASPSPEPTTSPSPEPTASPSPEPTASPTPEPDTVAPEAPTFQATDPATGGDTPTVRLIGTAEAGATVKIHSGEQCSGPPVATGSAASFGSPGIEVPVAQNATSSFTATATDATGNQSACSMAVAFVERAHREVEPNATKSEADTAATTFGVLLDGQRPLAGTVDPLGDADLFRVAVPQTSAARVSIAAVGDGTCATMPSIRITLLDAEAAGTVGQADALAGDCATLTRVLPGGTSYVRIAAAGVATETFGYSISVAFLPGAKPTETVPASPSTDPEPRVIGIASPGANVELFTSPDCSGAPVATGSAEAFATTGLTVSVPPQSTRVIRARATVDGATGPCSYENVTYGNLPAEVEPNDTREQADARAQSDGVLITGDSFWRAELSPATDVDVFKIQLDQPIELRLVTRDADGSGCVAPVDTLMRLLDAGGSQVAINDDEDAAAGNLCSAIQQVLEAGSYHVRVENFTGETAAAYPYTLRATALSVARALTTTPVSPAAESTPLVTGTSTAGAIVDIHTNGDCAGRPVGSGTAEVFAAAGIAAEIGENRIRRIYTRARAGDLIGSCTSSSLIYESTAGRPAPTRTEQEPNNTPAGADAQGFVAVPGDLVAGSLTTDTDIDLFAVALGDGATVRIETLDATAGDCPTDEFDTRLRLLAADGATVVATDDDSGIAFCDSITRTLAAGNYYVEIGRGSGTGPITGYRLALSAPADAEPEAEITTPADSNDTPSASTVVPFGDVTMRGDHEVSGDVDWYRVTLPRLASLRIEITEGSEAESCESGGIDSRITVFAPDQTTPIAVDDDGGRGKCSLLDGTGSAPRDAGLYDLSADTYYLRVEASSTGDNADRQFAYRLNLIAR